MVTGFAYRLGRENADIYKIPLEGGAPKLIAMAGEMIGNVKETEDGGGCITRRGDADLEIRVVSSNGAEDHAVAGMPSVTAMTDLGVG